MEFDHWQSFLDRILQEPEHELLEKDMDAGRVPIGYTCSYVPRAILAVDGLVPVRVRAPGSGGTEIADIYLSNVNCSYTRSLLEFALDDRYHFLGGWVFAAGCDHIRRLLDNLEYLIRPDFMHMVDAPHRRGDEALAWFTEELGALCRRLTDTLGVDTGPAALQEAIRKENAFNRALQEIADLRKRENPPLTGTEFQRIMIASLAAGRDHLAQMLPEAAEVLGARQGKTNHRARLMVVGGNMDDTDFIRAIESMGGLVVADRFCTGSLPGIEQIEETGDPLADIARHTLERTACPRMMEDFNRRLEDILHIREEYAVDGVIVETIKFCDIWGIETSLLASGLREAGVPVLRLERDYRLSGEGQLRTRVQAFLERMGK